MNKKLLVNVAASLFILLNGTAVFAGTMTLDSIVEEAQDGQIKQALVDVDSYIEAHPTSDEAHLVKAELLYSDHQSLVKVLNEIDQAVALNPGSVRNLGARAQVEHVLNDYAATISDYERILAISPTNISAVAALYDIHLELGDLKAALRDAEMAAKIQPDNAGIYVAMAEIYDKLSDSVNALASLRKAAQLYTAQNHQDDAGVVNKMIAQIEKSGRLS